jgi:hypothetical protein
MGAESTRRRGPRAVPGRRVSPSLASFWEMAGNEVMAEAESIWRWLLARLLDEADERRDGVEEVLMDARFAMALEVLSRA